MGVTGGVESINKVQEWSLSALGLKKAPVYKTILRILQNEESITSLVNSHGHRRKKSWSTRKNSLDEQLRLWVWRMWDYGIFLTDSVIMEKGRRLQNTVNLALSEHEHSTCKFSNGWLHAFKRRHEFKHFKSHGAIGDADTHGAQAALPRLRELVSQYALVDIFNADEFGLYYTTTSTSSIGPAPLTRKKKSTERVTFLVYTNVDGTEYIPPLMVGKSRRPRCFGGHTSDELGIDYDVGSKAWMNTEIFTRRLQRFDAKIGQTPGRRALFFIDNALSHGTPALHATLLHTRVEFLPKNTTHLLQPLDFRVIACVKRRYKQRIAQRAVDLINAGNTNNLYKVDIRQAAMWIYDIWARLDNDVVYNCWHKSSMV